MDKTLHECAVELLDALQLIKGTPMKYDGLHIIETALKNYAESEVKKISSNSVLLDSCRFYEPSDSTGMPCKNCGESKWSHQSGNFQ